MGVTQAELALLVKKIKELELMAVAGEGAREDIIEDSLHLDGRAKRCFFSPKRAK